MLPSTLDITRDECRGILRRLELESYSNVVSTFRAQGGLSDIKKKILEDLRNVFHISQDRHRAEVRRVANDEQLCTIAEAISGPNTTQEWCQEGRRSFPLLARSFAYTAYSSVANAVAEKLIIENAKVPPLSEIQQTQTTLEKAVVEENIPSIPIVKEDPMIPTLDEKKKIKRPLSQTEKVSGTVVPSPPSQRKRTVSNEVNKQLDEQNQVHTNVRIQQIYHNHCKTVSRHKKSTSTKRKSTATNKETTTTENAKISLHKNNNTINNTVETSSSFDKNKLNVPNPQVLHTYASVSQKAITQNNSRNTDIKSPLLNDGVLDAVQSLTQMKNSYMTPLKKETLSNALKLSLSQPKQNLLEDRKNEKSSNVVHLRQIPEKMNTNSNISQTTFTLNENPSKVPIVGNTQKVSTIIMEKNISKIDHPNSYSLDNSNARTSKEININEVISNHQLPLPLRSPSTKINSSCSSPTIVQIKPPQSIVPVETKKVVRELTLDNSNIQKQQQEKPPIIKNSLPLIAKRKIHITNTQILPPIKFSANSLQNRRGIKIISSANGQVFIQSATPADPKIINSSPSSPKVAKIISTQKGIVIPSTTITSTGSVILGSGGNTITSAILPNRGKIQKIHLVPKANNKQQPIITKSPLTNKIFVHNASNVTNLVPPSTVAIENTNNEIKNHSFIGNVILEKPTKHENSIILPQNLFQSTLSSPPSLSSSSSSSSMVLSSTTATSSTSNNIISLPSQSSSQAQSNVIVIGSIPPNKNKSDDNSQNLYNDNNDNQLHKNNIITEDTPVYILTAPVTNLDKSSAIDLNCISAATNDNQNFDHKTKSVQIINTNEIQGGGVEEEVIDGVEEVQTEIETSHNIEYNSENISIANEIKKEHHDIIIDESTNNKKQTSNKDYIYEVTDWEVELDQEAIRSKEKNNSLSSQGNTKIILIGNNNNNNEQNEQVNINNNEITGIATTLTTATNISSATLEETTTNSDSDNNALYMSDNFHDVIEIEGMESDDGGIIEETNVNYENSYSSQVI